MNKLKQFCKSEINMDIYKACCEKLSLGELEDIKRNVNKKIHDLLFDGGDKVEIEIERKKREVLKALLS